MSAAIQAGLLLILVAKEMSSRGDETDMSAYRIIVSWKFFLDASSA